MPKRSRRSVSVCVGVGMGVYLGSPSRQQGDGQNSPGGRSRKTAPNKNGSAKPRPYRNGSDKSLRIPGPGPPIQGLAAHPNAVSRSITAIRMRPTREATSFASAVNNDNGNAERGQPYGCPRPVLRALSFISCIFGQLTTWLPGLWPQRRSDSGAELILVVGFERNQSAHPGLQAARVNGEDVKPAAGAEWEGVAGAADGRAKPRAGAKH